MCPDASPTQTGACLPPPLALACAKCRSADGACLPPPPAWPVPPNLCQTMQERVRLDAILTVVDAKHILQHLDDSQIQEGAENEVGYLRGTARQRRRSG